jgi:acetyl esterase/lipase
MPSEDILDLTPPPADLQISYGEDSEQFADLRLPKGAGPFPTVMNIHGGFWRAKYNRSHAGHLCAALTNLGMATWNIEYRRAGMPGGGWPGTSDDVLGAHRKLLSVAADQNLDPQRILVMGHSAGGHLALCAAAREAAITRVICLAAVTDAVRAYSDHLGADAIVTFLGGTPAQVPDLYAEADPMRLRISRNTMQWLVHGGQDKDVPVHFSRGYAVRKKGAGETIRFNEVAGAGHFDLIDPRSAVWPLVVQAVSELLALERQQAP